MADKSTQDKEELNFPFFYRPNPIANLYLIFHQMYSFYS